MNTGQVRAVLTQLHPFGVLKFWGAKDRICELTNWWIGKLMDVRISLDRTIQSDVSKTWLQLEKKQIHPFHEIRILSKHHIVNRKNLKEVVESAIAKL